MAALWPRVCPAVGSSKAFLKGAYISRWIAKLRWDDSILSTSHDKEEWNFSIKEKLLFLIWRDVQKIWIIKQLEKWKHYMCSVASCELTCNYILQNLDIHSLFKIRQETQVERMEGKQVMCPWSFPHSPDPSLGNFPLLLSYKHMLAHNVQFGSQTPGALLRLWHLQTIAITFLVEKKDAWRVEYSIILYYTEFPPVLKLCPTKVYPLNLQEFHRVGNPDLHPCVHHHHY